MAAFFFLFAVLVGSGLWSAVQITDMYERQAGGALFSAALPPDAPGGAAEQAGALPHDPGAYPDALLELLERNPETRDFVAGYANREEYLGQSFSYEVQKGTLPHLLQWDARWGYEPYGDTIMGLSGCAPTCLAMVSARLTGNAAHTPPAIAAMSEQEGYYTPGTGTSWDLLRIGCEKLGIRAAEIPLEENSIRRNLEEGRPVICSVRPGDFTTTGHFIVLCGVAENGEIMVKDPSNISRTEQTWPYERLAGQIKILWAYEEI